jgi:hypothetical protein
MYVLAGVCVCVHVMCMHAGVCDCVYLQLCVYLYMHPRRLYISFVFRQKKFIGLSHDSDSGNVPVYPHTRLRVVHVAEDGTQAEQLVLCVCVCG